MQSLSYRLGRSVVAGLHQASRPRCPVAVAVQVSTPATRYSPQQSGSWGGGGSSAGYASSAGPSGDAAAGDEEAGSGAPYVSEGSLLERGTGVFATLGIYKGKGAMQLKVIPPQWKPTAKGGSQVDREGAVLFEFANVAQGQGSQGGYGARSYSWDKKIMFAVKVFEASAIAADSEALKQGNAGLSLIHDPNKGGANSGQVTKTLKVSAANPDGSYFFNLSQRGGEGAGTISVNVTGSEMAAIRTIIQYAVPRMLGFDVVFDLSGPRNS